MLTVLATGSRAEISGCPEHIQHVMLLATDSSMHGCTCVQHVSRCLHAMYDCSAPWRARMATAADAHLWLEGPKRIAWSALIMSPSAAEAAAWPLKVMPELELESPKTLSAMAADAPSMSSKAVAAQKMPMVCTHSPSTQVRCGWVLHDPCCMMPAQPSRHDPEHAEEDCLLEHLAGDGCICCVLCKLDWR